MKHKITLSIALALSVVLVSLMKSDSTANAAPPQRFVADTGVVALGPNQELRVAVGDVNNDGTNDIIGVRFRRMEYTEVVDNGGVWRLAEASQTTSDPITLMPGEAASLVVDPTNPNVVYVRAAVLSNSRNVRVNAMIIDSASGEVRSIIAILIG